MKHDIFIGNSSNEPERKEEDPTEPLLQTSASYNGSNTSGSNNKRRILDRRPLSGFQKPFLQFLNKERGSTNDPNLILSTSSSTTSGYINTYIKSFQQKNSLRRWQCACGCGLISLSFMSILITTIFVLFYVFRTPYVYLDQISIASFPQPTVSSSTTPKTVSFYVDVEAFNMNIADSKLSSMILDHVSIKDMTTKTSYDLLGSQSISWDFESNSTLFDTMTIPNSQITKFSISLSIDLSNQGLSSDVINKISNLIVSSLQSGHYVQWIFKGWAKVKVANVFYKTVGIEKDQQYFVAPTSVSRSVL